MKRALTLLLACLMLMTLLSGCKGRTPDDGKETGTPGHTADYTYTIDIGPYRTAIESDNKGYQTLVNKSHTVGKGFSPKALSTLDPSMTLYGKEVRLEATVALAVEALIKELHAQGWTDIVVTSGYRDYEYQQNLFNKYLADEKKAHSDWSAARCEEEVLTYSARPGTSEHQTGLCVDLINTNNPKLDESFAAHPAYAWLQENAFKFGFILRFPEGKEDVTGYSYEPWHYRFVGIAAAKEIHDAGITLEEYLTR